MKLSIKSFTKIFIFFILFINFNLMDNNFRFSLSNCPSGEEEVNPEDVMDNNFVFSLFNCPSEEVGEVNPEDLIEYETSSEKNSSKQKINIFKPMLSIDSKKKNIENKNFNQLFYSFDKSEFHLYLENFEEIFINEDSFIKEDSYGIYFKIEIMTKGYEVILLKDLSSFELQLNFFRKLKNSDLSVVDKERFNIPEEIFIILKKNENIFLKLNKNIHLPLKKVYVVNRIIGTAYNQNDKIDIKTKIEILLDIRKSISILYKLGYSHNNLSMDNVVFHPAGESRISIINDFKYLTRTDALSLPAITDLNSFRSIGSLFFKIIIGYENIRPDFNEDFFSFLVITLWFLDVDKYNSLGEIFYNLESINTITKNKYNYCKEIIIRFNELEMDLVIDRDSILQCNQLVDQYKESLFDPISRKLESYNEDGIIELRKNIKSIIAKYIQ